MELENDRQTKTVENNKLLDQISILHAEIRDLKEQNTNLANERQQIVDGLENVQNQLEQERVQNALL